LEKNHATEGGAEKPVKGLKKEEENPSPLFQGPEDHPADVPENSEHFNFKFYSESPENNRWGKNRD
jgi:hypothetical protein